MKFLTTSSLLQLCTFLLLACLPVGCSLLDHRPLPLPLSNCRLTSLTSPLGNQVILTYTADGLLASYGNDRYTYNAEGFVLTNIIYDGSTPYIRHTYRYSQGRLVSDVEYRYATDRNLVTRTYEYDSSGQLTRLVHKVTGGALVYTDTYLFNGGKQTGYIHYDGSTGVETQPYRFENGLIKQATNRAVSGIPASITEYTYNAAGQLVSQDDEGIGIYHTYEYITGRPALAAVPAFKGWPILTPNATSVLAKDTQYRKDATGGRYKSSEGIYTYVQTAAGYPLSEQVDYRIYNPAGELTSQGRLSRTIYTYDNCQ